MAEGKEILILTGGTLSKAFFSEVYRAHPDSRILCVDGALEKVYEWHIPVDIILGDFDTVSLELLEKYQKKRVPESVSAIIEEYDPEKDLTDTHLAIERAMREKPEQIIVLGATGSRLDHVIANLHAMYECFGKETAICFVDPVCRISMMTGKRKIKKNEAYGSYLSILPFSGTAKKVTLQGVKYPVWQRDFSYGESIGISNEIVENTAQIEVEGGVLLVIEAKEA